MLLSKTLVPVLLLLTLCTACPAKKKQETPPPPVPTEAKAPPAAPSEPGGALNLATPVDSVKGFFDAVSKEQYNVAWATLTKASQDKFISMVAEDEKLDPAKVREMFSQNQMPIRIGFWRSFRNSSKLDIVAPGATYKVLNEGPEMAEVEMTSGDVVLKSKTYKEGGQWKMGYVETFLP